MGCNSMAWCKEWEERPAWRVTALASGGHHPNLLTLPTLPCSPCPPCPALQQQPPCCWPTLPGKGGAPRETLLALIAPSVAVNDSLQHGLKAGWSWDLLKFPSSRARGIYLNSVGPHLPGDMTVQMLNHCLSYFCSSRHFSSWRLEG